MLLMRCSLYLANTIQKRINMSSTQLLYQSAPFQVAVLFVSGPSVDQMLTKKNVFAHKYSPIVLALMTTRMGRGTVGPANETTRPQSRTQASWPCRSSSVWASGCHAASIKSRRRTPSS